MFGTHLAYPRFCNARDSFDVKSNGGIEAVRKRFIHKWFLENVILRRREIVLYHSSGMLAGYMVKIICFLVVIARW